MRLGADGRKLRSDKEWRKLFNQVFEAMQVPHTSLTDACNQLGVHTTSLRMAAGRLRDRRPELQAFDYETMTKRKAQSVASYHKTKKLVGRHGPTPRTEEVSISLPTMPAPRSMRKAYSRPAGSPTWVRQSPFTLTWAIRIGEEHGVVFDVHKLTRAAEAIEILNEVLGLNNPKAPGDDVPNHLVEEPHATDGGESHPNH